MLSLGQRVGEVTEGQTRGDDADGGPRRTGGEGRCGEGNEQGARQERGEGDPRHGTTPELRVAS